MAVIGPRVFLGQSARGVTQAADVLTLASALLLRSADAIHGTLGGVVARAIALALCGPLLRLAFLSLAVLGLAFLSLAFPGLAFSGLAFTRFAFLRLTFLRRVRL